MSEKSIHRAVGIDDILLESDIVREMMETPPHWLISSGMLMIALVAVLALFLSVIIRYPEQITAETRITYTPKPQYLSLPENAKILKILVDDEQLVFVDQPLLKWHYPDKPEQINQLKAPVSGRLFWVESLVEKAIIEKQTDVFLLVANNTKIHSGIYVPEIYKDKVKPGQKVSIELQAFIHTQHGFLVGAVKSVSKFANEHGIWIEFTLPEKPITDRNFKLPFQPTMQGVATVNINNKRIIERIFARASKLVPNAN